MTLVRRKNSHISSAPHHRRSTIGLFGARVALAPSRSLTSYLRRAYKEYYHGRYRLPAWIFALDVFLVSLVVALVGVDCMLLITSNFPYDGGVAVTFSAPPLRASEDIPITVQVRAKDAGVPTKTCV